MKIVVEDLGEFTPTEYERSLLHHYQRLRPQYDPKELLRLLYVSRCIQLATESQSRRSTGPHVRASDLLVVAPLAALNVFGEGGKDWLQALALESSKKLGDAVSRFVADGILSMQGDDRMEDFDVISEFDGFMKKTPNQAPQTTPLKRRV